MYVLSSNTASTYQIHTFDVKSMKKEQIWGEKELESGNQFKGPSITAYNGKIAQVQDSRLEIQDFNHLRYIDEPWQFNKIINFAGCSVDNVIHGALLVENRELQHIYTWTYKDRNFELCLSQPIPHNKKYTRIARHESLLAVCTETQKKAKTLFVDVLIWRVGPKSLWREQRIRVSSKVIDFTEHSADSFCIATETEIVLVDGQNIKVVEEYQERAIAVRYNPQTKKWKRLLRTQVTYNVNGKEQVKNYVIDSYGKKWIIITDDCVLERFREGERESKRSEVPGSLILHGFFEGGKVITYDESGDPTIRGYTLENDDKNECKVEEKGKEKSEQDDEESDENESDENESDENESDENESDENESDENEFDENKCDWEIEECLGLFTVHGVGDKIFLITSEYLSIIRDQRDQSITQDRSIMEVQILLKKDGEEFEFA